MSTAELHTTNLQTPVATMAQLVHGLGDVPLDRILAKPAPGTATEQDLLWAVEHEDIGCELVDGVLLVKPMGYVESILAMELSFFLQLYLRKHPLGAIAGELGLCKLDPGLVRVPDLSFVTTQRLVAAKSLTFCPGAPDLCIEILSATNTKREMERKLKEYFKHGSRLVWYIDPESRTAQAFTSPTDVQTIAANGSLDGQFLLPGLQISLPELFQAFDRRLGQLPPDEVP